MLDETLIATILIAIAAPILGVAFPILMEMISRLDDKYSSEIIISLFEREKSKRLFLPILIICIATFLLWLPRFHPLLKTNIPFADSVVGHSGILLVFASIIFLLACFFDMLQRIITYYTPQHLLKYFIRKHAIAFLKDDLSYFLAISDILYFSINKQNEKLAFTASEFMYSVFKAFRQNSAANEIIYPKDYYYTVSKSIEELAEQKNNKRITFLAHRTAGGIWLLGEYDYYKISEETHAHIWNNLLLSLNYKKEDYVMYHWEVAHQYFSTTLNPIQPRFLEKGFNTTNQKEIDDRNKERNRFLEFYIALGGVLLYKGEHNCIKRMFAYSQSLPPRQYLLTETLSSVFCWYFHFIDPYGMQIPFLSHKYYFPNLEGVMADETVKLWILKYISLLFIRQYTVTEYYVFSNSLAVEIPSKQAEKRMWLDKMPYFRTLVNETLSDNSLLNSVNLGLITESWIHHNKKPSPNEIFDRLEKQVKEAFEQTAIVQDLSEEKIIAFNSGVGSVLEDTFKEYSKLSHTQIESKFAKYSFGWVYDIMPKEIFAKDVGITHLNFESAMAGATSMNFKDTVSVIFAQLASIKYVVKPENLVDAFKKLNVNSEEFAIVSFGDTHFQNIKSQHLNAPTFFHFPDYNFQFVGNSHFVLKREDLPELIFHEPSSDDRNRYKLKEANQEFNIYTSIIDLNTNEEIREKYEKGFQKGDDIRKYVFVMIYLNIEFRIRERLKIIQIEEASIYKDSAIPTALSDINPFQ